MALTQVDQGLLSTNAQYTGFKNRLINGSMVLDQRNAGASVTPASGSWVYSLDRWATFSTQSSKLSVQQVTDAPAGFISSLKVTSLSAYSVSASDIFSFKQAIEGFNFQDFMYGTANAATFTLSFWVKSSLTGTFGGALQNSAGTRGYAFTYTVSTANTWEQKTLTITGDQSGTWIGSTNGVGITVVWGLGVGSTYSISAGAWSTTATYTNSATGATSVVGTSGATWYVTGVQLEKGSTATSFDYRPYTTELALAQRYFISLANSTSSSPMGNGYQQAALTTSVILTYLPVSMRTSPTATFQNLLITDNTSHSETCSSIQNMYVGGNLVIYTNWVHASGGTAFRPCSLQAVNATVGNCFLNFSAEL
jgi:hypothetical protein